MEIFGFEKGTFRKKGLIQNFVIGFLIELKCFLIDTNSGLERRLVKQWKQDYCYYFSCWMEMEKFTYLECFFQVLENILCSIFHKILFFQFSNLRNNCISKSKLLCLRNYFLFLATSRNFPETWICVKTRWTFWTFRNFAKFQFRNFAVLKFHNFYKLKFWIIGISNFVSL